MTAPLPVEPVTEEVVASLDTARAAHAAAARLTRLARVTSGLGLILAGATIANAARSRDQAATRAADAKLAAELLALPALSALSDATVRLTFSPLAGGESSAGWRPRWPRRG
jgi:predicted permease